MNNPIPSVESMCIYVKNIPAKFHSEAIRKRRILRLFKEKVTQARRRSRRRRRRRTTTTTGCGLGGQAAPVSDERAH